MTQQQSIHPADSPRPYPRALVVDVDAPEPGETSAPVAVPDATQERPCPVHLWGELSLWDSGNLELAYNPYSDQRFRVVITESLSKMHFGYGSTPRAAYKAAHRAYRLAQHDTATLLRLVARKERAVEYAVELMAGLQVQNERLMQQVMEKPALPARTASIEWEIARQEIDDLKEMVSEQRIGLQLIREAFERYDVTSGPLHKRVDELAQRSRLSQEAS